MPLDPRSPVLVGLHQLEQRVDDPLEGDEPLEMMICAAEAAAEDAGSRHLLESADVVSVIRGRWHYDDPARAVAMGSKAVDHAATFGWDATVDRTLSVYAEAIESKASER